MNRDAVHRTNSAGASAARFPTADGPERLAGSDALPDVRYENPFLPINSRNLSKGYQDINFKPLLLRSKVLGAVIAFNLACLCSIVAVIRCADKKGQYHTNYPHIRLVVRYVPTVVGTLTTLFYRSMRDTYVRIQPYISMADQDDVRHGCGSKTVGLQYIVAVDLFNPSQHPLSLAIIVGNYLATQITGYKAALFTTVKTDEGWIVLVHATIGWVLFSIYLLVIFLYLWTLLKLWSPRTGLKWDPICIVDQLALFHGSNILEDFRILEESPEYLAQQLLRDKNYRLGYWEKGVDKDIWYGIGRTSRGSPLQALPSSDNAPEYITAGTNENEPTAATSATASPAIQPQLSIRTASESEDASNPNLEPCRDGTHVAFCQHPREHLHSFNHWCRSSLFQPWTVFFWAFPIIAGLATCIYSITSGVVKNGFIINDHHPYNNTSNATFPIFNITSSGGDLIVANFDPGNSMLWALFVFRTILVVLASYLAIAWISSVDQSVRFSQPFANMYHKFASAEDSILLDYLWGLPGLTTINALMNGHYKVAWFSLLNSSRRSSLS